MLCVAMIVGTASTAAPEILAQATSAAAVTRLKATPSKGSTVDAVEARIKDLHSRLKITPAQEDLWNNATQVMRENAKTMDALRKARSEKAQTMTAVEDFKSYGEITEAHADGIKKFVPVFSALYDSMSDAQKKNADTIFRRSPGQKAAR
jgi:hypothetical protein